MQSQRPSANAELAEKLANALIPESDRPGTDVHLLKRTIFQRLRFRWQSKRDRKIIERSGLFDEAWYRKTYSDIGDKPMNALQHYLDHGRFENRNPNPYFDAIWYLRNYPDVRISGADPLAHYIRHGVKKGRDPGPHFSTGDYLAQHPKIAKTDINPLHHSLLQRGIAVRMSNRGQPTVVIIDVIYPTPDKDSGSIDAANFINVFLELGFRVVFIADTQFGCPWIDKGWVSQTAAEVIDYNMYAYASIDDYIAKEGKNVDVFMLSRVHSGGRYLERVRHHSDAKVVFNTVDLHFLRERRAAELASDPVAMNLANVTYERELHLCRMADATIVVSEVEGALLQQLVSGANIAVIPLARNAPGSKKSSRDRKDVGFIGGFGHTANLDAVAWFVAEIWPLVRKREPALQFYIYGSNMPATFAQYVSQGVMPIGYIDTVDIAMDERRVMVAPLRYGAGAKGKVVSSLAHGVPCVATSIAAEGMGLSVGKDILVADDAEQFAAEIVSLCTDDAKWDSVSTSGFSFVERHYSYKGMVEKVRDLLSSLDVFVRSDPNETVN